MRMKMFWIFIIVKAFLLHTAISAESVLDKARCGYLLDGDLLDNSSISFSATSGDPGRPLLSGEPWKPTDFSIQNSLTVDLGGNYNVSKMVWSGDPAAIEQTYLMLLKYSYDGITYFCKKGRFSTKHCKLYFGNYPPPVPAQKINVVDLGTVITARYFRFVPLEPSPGIKPGSQNLRIDLIGCVKVKK